NGSPDSTEFQVQGWESVFLFATLDGTISGWSFSANPNAAILAATTPGAVYVAFASSSGAAGGCIDIYSESGVLLKQLTHGSPLNQPWGFAIAPKNFGPLSNALLVSNNTNGGTINAFNSVTGQFVGTIRDTAGNNIVINQLW